MKIVTRNRERGIALFFSIFALLLLTAIAGALIFMANTETSVNSNYRNEQIAYFGAKAGIEEARARMMASDPNTINAAGTQLPTAVPTTANNGVIYIVNPGAAANSVQPWNSANTYADDEICHEGYGTSFGTVAAPDVRCALTTLPAGTGWYTSYSSALPFSGTASTLPYKWVRLAPKLNSSVSYLTGTGATATIGNYLVNTTALASAPICWNGVSEVPLTTGLAYCAQMSTAGGAPMTTVYLMTALGVSPTGARKMVQAEVALSPNTAFIFGLFADSSACPAVTFSGNLLTDSYTTAGGQTYASSNTKSGSDVGTNGGVTMSGNATVNGIVGVLPPAPVGPCATPFTTSGGASPATATYLTAPTVFPAPPLPNPPTPNTTYNPPDPTGCATGACMTPGTYGNISLSGKSDLTLAPGTYNINSLSMSGQSQISVSPPGAVVLNIGGTNQNNALSLSGQGIINDNIPNDFMINYGGTGTVTLSGQGNTTGVLNAPLAPTTLSGQGAWYGAILGSTLTISGNGAFHYDRNTSLAPPNNGYYTLISFREVPY
jgi:hypothetical protein